MFPPTIAPALFISSLHHTPGYQLQYIPINKVFMIYQKVFIILELSFQEGHRSS